MKKTNRFLSVILALMMIISVIPMSAIPASAATSGTCGDNLTWEYDEESGVLAILGTGAMYNYGLNNRPWEDYADEVYFVDIGDNVTTISNFAFYGFSSLNSIVLGNSITTIGDCAFESAALISVTIPVSVVSIGVGAFWDNSRLMDVYYDGTEEQWNAITIGYDNDPLFCAQISFKEVTTNPSGLCGENATWEFDPSTGILTISGTGEMTDFVVKTSSWPHQNNRPWEDYKNSITSVIIEEGVTTIGKYAFYDLSKLKNVTISDSVTKIGFWAFTDCVSLESLIIPDSVTTIDVNAFADCTSLIEVTLSNNLTVIGGHAFSGCCSLKDITIPDSVEIIAQYAFYGCESLTNITIPDSVITIGEWAFGDCTNLVNVKIGNNVTTLDKYVFSGCYNIKNLAISESVTTIGESAFARCDSLTGITVDKENQYYSSDEYGVLFDKTKTTLLEYPVGNTRTSYTIPDGVTVIDTQAFLECENLTSVTIPNSVISIGNGAFRECSSLTSIIIPDGITIINEDTFLGCINLASVTIPNSVTIIGNAAFRECTSLTSITIPDSVTTIDNYAFEFCSGFTGITIPNSVTTIGNLVFHKCTNLTSITIPDSVTSIGSAIFEDCTALKTVTISNNATKISSHLFDGCTNLENFVIPDTVTSIEYAAFENCTSLKNITIPDSVTTIADDAFSGCTSLENITIPNGITEIDWFVFRNCTSLKSIVIPDSVTAVGRLSFFNCTNLKDVYYFGTEEQWNAIEIDSADNGNNALLNATIHYNYVDPDKFTGIQDNHFYKNDVMQKAYQLVEFDGDFYFIGDRHEIIKGRKAYLSEERINGLTYADGTPIAVGSYDFDENGKMIILNGVVGNNVYKNNIKLKAYQLVEVDGDFYFIGDRHEIIKGRKAYLSKERINGLTYADGTPIAVGSYDFDENGKMIILDGVIGNNVYKNNIKLKAYQLVEVDGDFYFIGDRHEIVKNKRIYLNEERINGLTYADGTPITVGHYNVDADGKLIIE